MYKKWKECHLTIFTNIAASTGRMLGRLMHRISWWEIPHKERLCGYVKKKKRSKAAVLWDKNGEVVTDGREDRYKIRIERLCLLP